METVVHTGYCLYVRKQAVNHVQENPIRRGKWDCRVEMHHFPVHGADREKRRLRLYIGVRAVGLESNLRADQHALLSWGFVMRSQAVTFRCSRYL